MKNKIKKLKLPLSKMTGDEKDNITKEISFIKEEIKTLKITLSEKADKEKLKILEFKINRIESQLKLA